MTSRSAGDKTPDLLLLLSWASHALMAEQAAALAELNISPRAHCVLRQAQGGELTQRQIGDLCGVDKTTMVVTLDQLEAAGLAQRRLSPTDRRARLIAVTPEGERVLERAREIARRIQDDVLAALPDGDREALLRALGTLVTGRFAGAPGCGPANPVQ
ncbi:MarR family transcriptional regulator [Micromonospora sp. NPDC094482]|uniref:MarR family winged helix-turn-helix transcriptional regulator n=1 Tax=unclassified Micromonospora TaxID=2617518 RepID=UPI00332E2C21